MPRPCAWPPAGNHSLPGGRPRQTALDATPCDPYGRALDGPAQNALQDIHAARPVDAVAVVRGFRARAAGSRDDASFPRRGRGTGRHVRSVPRPGFAAHRFKRPREPRSGRWRQPLCACAAVCPRRGDRGARLSGAARLTLRRHPGSLFPWLDAPPACRAFPLSLWEGGVSGGSTGGPVEIHE